MYMNKLPEKSPNVTSIFVWSVIVGSSLGIKPPFISEWQTIVAQGQSPIYIRHSLGEMPIKVDVQVRVMREGSQHIFPGFGAGQRSDEDGDSQYGAVLCSYNESHVRLHVPVSTITTKGGLVSTGMTPLFFKVCFSLYEILFMGRVFLFWKALDSFNKDALEGWSCM